MLLLNTPDLCLPSPAPPAPHPEYKHGDAPIPHDIPEKLHPRARGHQLPFPSSSLC